MRKAFSYIFKDPSYIHKFIRLYALFFILLASLALPEILNFANISFFNGPKVISVVNPFLLCLPVFQILLCSIIIGYGITCINAIYNQNQNIVLPRLNLKNSLIKGIKFYFIIFLFIALITLLYKYVFSLNQISAILFTIFISLFFIISFIAFLWLYAIQNNTLAFFTWKKIFVLITQNLKNYLKSIFVFFLVIILSSFMSLLFMFIVDFLINNIYIAWIIATLVNAYLISYVLLVNSYIIAKSIKQISVV